MGFDLQDANGYPITSAQWLMQNRRTYLGPKPRPLPPMNEEDVKRLLARKAPIEAKPKN